MITATVNWQRLFPARGSLSERQILAYDPRVEVSPKTSRVGRQPDIPLSGVNGARF